MRRPHTRSSGRTFIAVLLVAVTIGLAMAIWTLSDAASANRDDPVLRDYFRWMTYLAMVLLVVTLALLAMRGVRWIAARFKPLTPGKPTSQVSAWVEAGKRFELPDEDESEDDERPSES
ncbi:MAG: hypothetical protein QGH60_12150 [Phycisphaerae bacterium]|nr:hypothetical protein [Phycisphaerae bacterium]